MDNFNVKLDRDIFFGV